MSKCVLLLIFAFSLLHCNTARSNTFSSAFQIELEKATNAPQAVIDEFEPLLGKKEPVVSFSQFEIHFLLGNAYYSQFLADKALFHYLAAEQIINKNSEPWRYYSLLSQLALAYELAGDATQALPFANDALQWAIQNQDLVLQQNALIAKGVTELTLGEYDNALESFQNAHSLSTEHPDAIKADNLSYYLALAHEYRGNYENAIKYYMQSANFFKENERTIEYSDALFGAAKANKNLKKYELALSLFNESMKISKDLDDKQGQAYTLSELSDVYLQQGDIENAHLSLITALRLFVLSNNPYQLVGVYKQLAEIAKDRNSISHALALSDIAIPLTNTDSLQMQYATLLKLQAKLFSAQGNYEQAYQRLLLATKNQTEYENKRNELRYEELQSEFELAKSIDENNVLALENANVNAELSANKQQSYLLFIVVLLLLALTAASLFMYFQSKRLQTKLSTLANTDSLTSLANRRTAFNTLVTQLKLAKREKFNLAVALVDLDNFKQINDQYGHAAGDKILKAFANLALSTFRSSDLVARIGGEEFLFIFPFTSVEQAQSLIIEFSDDLAYHESVTQVIGRKLTCSVGITDATQCDNEHDVLNVADKAMYRAKKIGRDAIVIS